MMVGNRTLASVILTFLLTSASYAVTPNLVQSASATGTNATITVTLPATPKIGNTVYVLLGSGIYTARTMTPPDSSWTCTSAAQVNVSLQTCSHIVVPGDGKNYTFIPTTTYGPAISGIIFEAANTVSAQVAYNYSGTPEGNIQLTTSPALVPSVVGMLPVSAIFGGQAAAGSTGWSPMQINGTLGSLTRASLTTDTTTPIYTTFSIPGYNSGSSIQEILLLTPGVVTTAPGAVPAAGSYPTAQSVVLGDSQPGAVIHYVMDGSTPTCSSPVYSSGINIVSNSTITFLACASGTANSAVMTARYVIGAGTLAGLDMGPMADLHGYVPFAGDAYHQTIVGTAVDANSAAIVAGLGSGHLHHDWSSIAGGNYGIPYTVIDTSVTPLVPFTNKDYVNESDVSLYPLPLGMPIESYPSDCQTTGDNHAIVLDKHAGVAYEMWRAQYCPTQTPQWNAVNGVIWDMTTNEKRPYGYTSVDAAGLSVFEGLVRYDEIAAGVINHAIRFTTAATRCDHYLYGSGVGAFVAPATHAACTGGGNLNIMGMRIRLKANFDISNYSPVNQIILTAMKTYGMILADNGSSMYFQGTPDARWNDDDLLNLDQVQTSNFEVMQMPTVYTAYNHPNGDAPVINSFTASSPVISAGQSVTLNASVTGASYTYVDKAGFFRGSSITVSPTQTTTYLLTTRNAFGETTASTTVMVGTGAASDPQIAFKTVPNQTVGAAAFPLSVTSQSTGAVNYSVTSGPATLSGNLLQVTGIGTVSLQAQQAAAGNYTSGQAGTTFTVTGTTPTLVFKPIADVLSGAASFPLTATSNSTGAIAYSVLSGPATIAGNQVTVNGVGIVTVQATQQAAGNYTVTTASESFNVTTSATTIVMNPIPDKTLGSPAFSVSCTSNSWGPSSYQVSGPATVWGNMVTITGVGVVTVTVKQAAAGTYGSGTASTTFTVTASTPGVQALAFVPTPSMVTGAPAFAVTATSSSPGTIRYSVVSGPAKLSGNMVTLTGAGSVTLQANQSASGTYPAATAKETFNVTSIATTVVMNPIPDKPLGSAAFSVSCNSNSWGASSYQVSGPARVRGNVVTITGAGVVTVTVNQAAAGAYGPGTASTTFNVTTSIAGVK